MINRKGINPWQQSTPRVFLNPQQRTSAVGDMGCWGKGKWIWEFSWRKDWFQWELPMVEGHQRSSLEGA